MKYLEVSSDTQNGLNMFESKVDHLDMFSWDAHWIRRFCWTVMLNSDLGAGMEGNASC